ncbi:MAG: hypothetical protein K0S26_1098 [Bacteroidota bacterium]|jgi:hypothetical protein|nr:hypothetical protein [Bacteroidota bacterium]
MGATENLGTIYSPRSLVSIFEKAFVVQEERKIIQIKGIYLKEGRMEYSGVFYDRLKDEASDYFLTLIMPSLHRHALQNNTTILFSGFITRKIDKTGKIDFQMNFIDLVNVTQNKFSDEDIQRLEIVNSKLKSGIKDLDHLIQQHVYSNTKAKIVIIIGKSAIIDNDIKSALGASVALFDINFVRVNIASPQEISAKIIELDNIPQIEVICVARGGGEQLEAFGKPELVKTILNRKAVIASAIGHADDVTLFEQASDKKFTTPTAFGTYLKTVYDNTIQELSKSKAKMQKDIQDQLKAIFDGQVKVLNEKFESTTKLHAQEKKTILENHEAYKKQLLELNDKRTKDMQLAANGLAEENKRLMSQLNEARQNSGSSGYIIVIVILVIILIAILTSKK